MQLVQSIIDALAALLIGAFALLYVTLFPTPVAPAPEFAQEASATPTEFPQAPAEETPAPIAAAPAKPAQAAEASQPTVQPAPTTPAPALPQKSESEVNAATRAALVNILCTTKTGFRGTSGSGVIIDSRGVILTNAHIGQYFLLRDYPVKDNVECAVRVGSPAEPRYTATLLYLPPSWVAANAKELAAAVASGTGEHDYAFLLITGRTDGSALPTSFPRLEMESMYPTLGEQMLLAAYPAGFLSGEIILKNLYASSALARVTQLFTFDDNRSKVDLFSIGGTVVSQGGSSGGAAVRMSTGKLTGVIVVATVAESTSNRDLRALSLAHINASLSAHGQGGIAAILSGELAAKADAFEAQTAPSLRTQLEQVLNLH